MRIALVVSMTLALSATAFAQSLSGNQIRQALIGHTISGVQNGKSYSEYLKPDGTISGRDSSGAYSGHWRIADNEICFIYEDSSKGWDCSGLKLRGNLIIWNDNTTATLSNPSSTVSPASGPTPIPYPYVATPRLAYRPAYGAAYETTPSYFLAMPSACAPPRGLFGGFCNCGCR